jgi:DNA polymerase-3 subunit gamma/tau
LTQTVLGTATSQSVLGLVDSIRDGAPAAGLETIHQALDAGADPRSLARQIVEYLRGLMLIQMGNAEQVETTRDARERMSAHAAAFSTQAVLRMMKVFNAAAVEARGGWQPALPLELALAESLDMPADVPASKRDPAAGPGQVPKPEAAKAAKAAPEVDPQAGAAQKSGEGTSVSLAEVTRAWKDIRAVIKPVHPGIEALLNSCKPMDVRGSELILGFQSDKVRALMDRPEQLEVTRRAIQDVLGLELQIKCVVTNARGKLPPDVPQDGMVATALNHGGEIVDIQE